MDHFTISTPTVTLPFLDMQVHTAGIWMAVITVGIVVFCVIVKVKSRRFSDIPGKFQLFLEFIVEGIDRFARGHLHEKTNEKIVVWGLTACFFLVATMILEMLNIRAPSSDLSVTLAMGLITFFWINYMAFHHLGFKGRIKAYFKPNAFMALIRFVTDIAKPISLACRLFGNVLAGLIVMELIYSVIPVIVPAALSIYFQLFHTAIQAYIFITLTYSFIGEAIE